MPESESTMHTFAEYAPRGDAQVAELVRHNPFAAVISTDHSVSVATHVPVITKPCAAILGHERVTGAVPSTRRRGGGVLATGHRGPGGVQAQPGYAGRALAAGSRQPRRQSGVGADGPRNGRGPARPGDLAW